MHPAALRLAARACDDPAFVGHLYAAEYGPGWLADPATLARLGLTPERAAGLALCPAGRREEAERKYGVRKS